MQAQTTLTRRESYVLLALLGTGVFLAGLELMVTAVALPAIVADLAGWTRLREASWIINGYLLVSVVTMPLAGRMADLYGTRRLFLWALVVFTAGSLLAGMAPTLELLIAARLVQAVGGGALVPVATAAASHLFSGPARPRALGVIGALTFLGMAAGPFLGAAILGAVHPVAALSRLGVEAGTFPATILAPAWRWVFYVNVPIGIIALIVAWAASSGWETPRRPGRLDFVGAILFSGLLVGAPRVPDASRQPFGTRHRRPRPDTGRGGARGGRDRVRRPDGRPRPSGERPVHRPPAVPPCGRSPRRRSSRR